jgi:ferredoxin
VCPTGAIRALPLEEKKVARMGLAVVDEATCLPWAETEVCELCVDECRAAGYGAIEVERVGVQVDAEGMPIEDTGFLAPVVLADRCVGCGLCQSACFRIHVRHRGRLSRAAIVVVAGPGKEDRIRAGSYRELRALRRREAEEARRARERELLEGLEGF